MLFDFLAENCPGRTNLHLNVRTYTLVCALKDLYIYLLFRVFCCCYCSCCGFGCCELWYVVGIRYSFCSCVVVVVVIVFGVVIVVNIVFIDDAVFAISRNLI